MCSLHESKFHLLLILPPPHPQFDEANRSSWQILSWCGFFYTTSRLTWNFPAPKLKHGGLKNQIWCSQRVVPWCLFHSKGFDFQPSMALFEEALVNVHSSGGGWSKEIHAPIQVVSYKAVNRTRDLHRTKEPSTFRRVYRHPTPMSRLGGAWRSWVPNSSFSWLENLTNSVLKTLLPSLSFSGWPQGVLPQTGLSCRIGIFRAMAIELKIMRYFLIRRNDSVLLILGSLKYS